jgi:MerR family transcriptional regulator, light-induced transcriptional regulator
MTGDGGRASRGRRNAHNVRVADGTERDDDLPVTRTLDEHLSGPLPISEVARLTGLPPTTLRAWQRRYGLTASEVSRGGHRRYSAADVDRLRAMAALVGEGMPTAEAAQVVLAPAEHGLVLPPSADPAAHHLASAALELDGPACRRLLRRHVEHHPVEQTWCDVVQPVLAAVGERWARMSHGIAVEHLLAHVAAGVLGEATPALDEASVAARPLDGASVVLACVPGEQHDLPLTVLAAVLGHHRVPVTLLGAATPVATLAGAVERRRPGVVLVLALLPELADPAVFAPLPGTVVPIAGGPGWIDQELPRGVLRVDDLTGAVQLIVENVRPDRSGR